MEGIIPPNSQIKVNVEVTLQEVGYHNAAFTVQGADAKNFVTVALVAKGVGTSLVFDPPLQDVLDFGLLFTYGTYCLIFHMFMHSGTAFSVK